MVYLVGDTHGILDLSKLNSKNFKEGANLTKDDYVIVLGDFGLVWDNSREDLYWRKWLDKKPWTTLFLDGNHENFNLLYEFPIEYKLGAKTHRVSDSIYHICRGEILEIADKKLFVFGGAYSVDKFYRVEGRSWWEQEMPTREEMNYGVENLEKVNFNVDFVLTHTCPEDVISYVVDSVKTPGDLERYFNFISNYLIGDFNWYFGHFHTDLLGINDKYNCLYRDIIRII